MFSSFVRPALGAPLFAHLALDAQQRSEVPPFRIIGDRLGTDAGKARLVLSLSRVSLLNLDFVGVVMGETRVVRGRDLIAPPALLLTMRFCTTGRPRLPMLSSLSGVLGSLASRSGEKKVEMVTARDSRHLNLRPWMTGYRESSRGSG
jgi:hypothetical protein